MGPVPRTLSNTFNDFFESGKSSAIVLIVCTVVSLLLANSGIGPDYLSLWQIYVGGLSVDHWINDGLMAVFFLLIGLELERELYSGELSSLRNALLPTVAAIGGLCSPALIHFALNRGTPTQAGLGIPMATDIAFALGVLALLGRRVPGSLKVFLTGVAVMDDLGAIIIIALFYTAQLSIAYLMGAIALFGSLVVLNRVGRVMSLAPYLLGGTVMWFMMLKSGVHATVAGVLLAFAIPFSARQDDEASPSHRLEHWLQKPVAFIVLPMFALANTGIVITPDWADALTSVNSLGISVGLLLGKPLGIALFSLIAVSTGIGRLPPELTWRHVFGAALLGGIGFTMSMFITNLAFVGKPDLINASKMAIVAASVVAGLIGYAWLRRLGEPAEASRG